MLSFDERMDNIESLTVKVYNDFNSLANDDEIDAVVMQIFDQGTQILESRIEAIANNLDIVEHIISTATG